MQLTWLGQAGYALEADNGHTIYIDPYCSNALLEKKGATYERTVPIDSAFLTRHVDTLILTHLHDDHTDLPTITQLVKTNPHIQILAPLNVLNVLRQHFTQPLWMLFDRGVEITLSGIHFRSTFAAHSDERPIGVVIQGDGVVICHTGDTMYHRSLLEEYPQGADVLLIPINGQGYNMNAVDAARLTQALAPKAVFPMHWDMFKAYGCDVSTFMECFQGKSAPNIVIPAYYQGQKV